MKKIFFCLLVFATAVSFAQLKGYNNPWFFGNFGASNGFYPPEDLINQIKALDPQLIRFPGGNIANGYDVTKPGYGYPKESGPNYIYNQIRLAEDLEAQTIFVANLYEPLTTPDSEAYWIDNIVQAVSIANPAYVELGNEIPIYPEITGVYAGEPGIFVSKALFVQTVANNATRYVNLCQKVIDAVHAAGFNPKFGVTMDQPFHTRGKTWDNVIRAWNGYDGEIFHIYLTTRDYSSTRAAIQKVLTGCVKPAWITEWGWVHGNGLTAVLNAGDIGTSYYNAFPTNFQNACAQDPRIALTCRHQLYGTNVYSLINPNNP